MEVETVHLIRSQCVDGVHNVRRSVVIARNIHVQPAVGELGAIDNADGRIGCVYAGGAV